MGRFCLGATILGMVWFTVPAFATTVLEKSFPDLVHEADTIVVGTVTAIATEQEHETPITLVTFSDLDILKGDTNQDTLTVQMMGGPTLDGRRFHIAGTPDFHLGDQMVVFIVGNETQAVPFVGMWQGVYRVVQDLDRGDTIATHAGQPLTVLPQRQSADGLVHDEAPYTVPPQRGSALSLETFLEAIEEEVQDAQ